MKEWLSSNSIFANVITGLTQPIFNQEQIKTRFEIAKAIQEKEYLQFEQSLLTAGKEVSDALDTIMKHINLPLEKKSRCLEKSH